MTRATLFICALLLASFAGGLAVGYLWGQRDEAHALAGQPRDLTGAELFECAVDPRDAIETRWQCNINAEHRLNRREPIQKGEAK